MFERADPELIDEIHTALSDPDPGRQCCALFDVEDCVSAALMLVWEGAEGQAPAQRFAAALQATLGGPRRHRAGDGRGGEDGRLTGRARLRTRWIG
jgi:hypothetical protein